MTYRWQQGIYAITDATLMPSDRQLFEQVEAVLEGGIALLQYRDKSRDDTHRYQQGKRLKQLCDSHGVPLIINDDVALAEALGAGVHLGQQDGSLASARQRLGSHAIIGATCHASLEHAASASHQGASYLAFGRFFASRTKPDAPPAPLSLLADAHRFKLPVVAIGGINASNLNQVIDAGADLAAVVHAVFGQPDPAMAVSRLNRLLR